MLHLSQITACWALPANSKAPEHWLIACFQFTYHSHKLTSHQIFKPEILSKSRVKKQRPFSKGVTLSFSCWQSCSETVKKTRASFNHGTTHSTLWTWLTSYRWLPNSLERKKSSFTQNSTKTELNRPPFSPKGSERLLRLKQHLAKLQNANSQFISDWIQSYKKNVTRFK